MDPIARIVETALYCDDLERAKSFYRDVLGLRVLSEGPRLAAIDAGQSTMLLLFRRRSTADGVNFPGGYIPPHDGDGPVHIAFAVSADALDEWEERLATHGIEVDGRA